MSIISSKSQPVLILGGGRGGLAFIELFQSEELFHVIGVADKAPDAPAFNTAKRLGISIFNDVEEALNRCKPCTVFNLTHDETISEMATSIVGPSSVIGGLEATLIWKMVTQLKEARDKLEKSHAFTESIITHAMEGIILINTRGIIKSFNPAAEFMFGYSQEDVVGKNISMLMPAPDSDAHDGYLKHYMETKEARVIGVEREVAALRRDGKTFYMSLAVNEMVSGEERFFIGIVRDISERKKSEAAIKQLAHFDAVTGLPNRSLFFDRLKQALAQAKRQKKRLAVLFLDLDGFKAVNDSLGHDVGDRLLKEVAKRLLKTIREMDTVARFGGDEFAFVVDDIENSEGASIVAKKILTALAKPFLVSGHRCEIGGSIGISLFPENSTSVATLIRQADIAMYVVKRNNKNNYRFFMEEMEADDKH